MKVQKIVPTLMSILGMGVIFGALAINSTTACAQPSGIDMAHAPTAPNNIGCAAYNCQITGVFGHAGNYLLDHNVPYSTCVRDGISFEDCVDGLSVVCADRTEWNGAQCFTGPGGSTLLATYEVVTSGTAPSRVDSAGIPNWP